MFTSVRVSPAGRRGDIPHGCQSVIRQIGRGLYTCSPTLLYAPRIKSRVTAAKSRAAPYSGFRENLSGSQTGCALFRAATAAPVVALSLTLVRAIHSCAAVSFRRDLKGKSRDRLHLPIARSSFARRVGLLHKFDSLSANAFNF